MRAPVAAVYAFARAADDFADEGSPSPEARALLLDGWLDRLHRCTDTPSRTAAGSTEALRATAQAIPDADLVFLALGDTIRRYQLPVTLFEDLVSAFRQDITTQRYDSWDSVLDYCRRSANPVGRLVLGIAGYRDESLARASDRLCTALQLTNFWQDLARDLRRDRLYVPQADWVRHGARLEDLEAGRVTPAWRQTMGEMASRTRALFHEGRAVCDGVRGRLRFELRLTWLGGMRVLAAVERRKFDVFADRPTLGPFDVPALVRGAVGWRSASRPGPEASAGPSS